MLAEPAFAIDNGCQPGMLQALSELTGDPFTMLKKSPLLAMERARIVTEALNDKTLWGRLPKGTVWIQSKRKHDKHIFFFNAQHGYKITRQEQSKRT